MEPKIANAYNVLNAFLEERLDGETGVNRDRMLLVHGHFRRCLDEDTTLRSTAAFRSVLQLELLINPEDAVLHLIGCDQLLWGLVAFLLDEWELPEIRDRMEQLRMIDDLRDYIVYNGLVCAGCEEHSLGHIRDGLTAARRELKERERLGRARNKRPRR
jgi:hypothetical protein